MPSTPVYHVIMSFRVLKHVHIAAVVAVVACTRGPSSPRPEVARTTLVIDNQSFVDHRIYVMNGSSRLRIGFAPGKHATKMTIPARIVTGSHMLVFVAEPMGGDRPARSEEIYVSEGDEVHLMIPPF